MKNRLKFLRRGEGYDYTQAELASKLGVSRQTIIDIENSVRIPSGELMLKIAHFFNKDVRDIFFINDVVSDLQGENERKDLLV